MSLVYKEITVNINLIQKNGKDHAIVASYTCPDPTCKEEHVICTVGEAFVGLPNVLEMVQVFTDRLMTIKGNAIRQSMFNDLAQMQGRN